MKLNNKCSRSKEKEMEKEITVLLVNNSGGGFADYKSIEEGTTAAKGVSLIYC